MSPITIAVLVFSALGAVDYLLGSNIGIGKEFEKAFSLFCPMALSMLGMLVIAPALGVWMQPLFERFYDLFGIDPYIIPSSVLANDMGGMSLSQAFCKTEEIGNYNAFIISSMMGCTVSFTVPLALGLVRKTQHRELFFGFLCGIATTPVGSIAAGLVLGIEPLVLLLNLLPLTVIAVAVAAALIFAQKLCIKCFSVFGVFMRALGVLGLACAIFTFLTKVQISPHFDTLENAALVCVNACVTLSGALPFMFIVSKLLHKPLNKLGAVLGLDEVSALALLGSLVTSVPTFGLMDKMGKKGVVLNSAFAVSAAFTFGSHLAFTMAFNENYVLPMIIGKLVSGICAAVLALLLYREDTQKAK
ncbi:MAG: ethanolamine utilization protein EutH [Clostridia bacterium]|nr:ethanolamine utilization protein EutH [Clostridia bacterium]